jgi:hypothetical protein
MITVFVASVLAFLLGMAVGIAGYAFTTLVAWEKEIEGIFQRMCDKYQKKIDHQEAENCRLHEALVDLQVKLAKGKEKKS